MMKLLVVSAAALLLVVVEVRSQGCSRYKNFSQHTMCIYTEKACPGKKLLRRGLTPEQRNEVVQAHNLFRQAVANGKVRGQPRAAYMPNLAWDDELAVVAQRLADQCRFQHDTNRNVARFRHTGQNLYTSSRSPVEQNKAPDFSAATKAWFNEVYNPGFNPAHISPFRFSSGTGHYTQVVWADTKNVGCGYSMYTDSSGWSHKLYVCNYGPGGNIIGHRMYEVKN